MTQPRYKNIPTPKRTPGTMAKQDYAKGEYNNPFAKQSREHAEYYQAYSELTLAEPLEETA